MSSFLAISNSVVFDTDDQDEYVGSDLYEFNPYNNFEYWDC